MRKHYVLLITLAVLSVLFYIFSYFISKYDLVIFALNDPDRAPNFIRNMLVILSNRSIRVIAIIISCLLISSSTLVFQTLTSNKIVTPSLLGLDSIYVMVQTTIVFFANIFGFLIFNNQVNFLVSVVCMSGLTILLYTLMLKKHKKNLLLILLVGMVISTLASNYSTFLQILMDPDAFQTVASLTSVSIVNIDVSITFVTLPIAIIIFILFMRKSRVYDVMSLGEIHAKNLGVKYEEETYISLILVSIAVAISTALVGPLSFLGLISVNAAREIYKKYQHKIVFIISSLIAIIFIVLGQTVIELLGSRTTVTTFINFIGGIYMIRLIIKEHKIWLL